jgi:hypothetical protein
MSRSPACADLRHELGAYLLGASAPADRKMVEDHLSSCPGCRDELADLAGLPALLGRVPADDVDVLSRDGALAPPPEEPLLALLSRVARRRRQRTAWLAAAAAAVGLLAGAAAIQGLARSAGPATAGSPPAGAITARGSDPVTDASAVVEYAPRPWGVALYVQVSGIPTGTRCSFDVTGSDGRESPAGGWTVTDGYENTWYRASSSVPAAAVRGFVVTAGGQPVVTVSVPAAQPAIMKGHR